MGSGIVKVARWEVVVVVMWGGTEREEGCGWCQIWVWWLDR